MLAAAAQKKQIDWEHKEIEKIRKVHLVSLSIFVMHLINFYDISLVLYPVL